jgi:hypothetical protein
MADQSEDQACDFFDCNFQNDIPYPNRLECYIQLQAARTGVGEVGG